jgi:hypothetical protein
MRKVPVSCNTNLCGLCYMKPGHKEINLEGVDVIDVVQERDK